MVQKLKTIKNTITIFRSDLEKIISMYESAKDRGESLRWLDINFVTEMKNSDTWNRSYLDNAEYEVMTQLDTTESTKEKHYYYKDHVDFNFELHNDNLTKIVETFPIPTTK